MKNDSPNKFLGGLTAGIVGGGARSGGARSGGVFSNFLNRSFGNAAQQVAGPTQAQQAASGGLAGAIGSSLGGSLLSGNTNLASDLGAATMDKANPFEGQTFAITPSNEMGNAAPMFKPGASNAAAKMYGTPLERQMSMPKSPLGFNDQTGDGKITQADVIKARTEGYSESPASMVEFERDYVSDGSYANPETDLDTGTGQAIADTISSIGASAAGAVGSGEGDGSKGLDRIKARGERQAARQDNRAQRQAARQDNRARRQDARKSRRNARKSRRNARKNK